MTLPQNLQNFWYVQKNRYSQNLRNLWYVQNKISGMCKTKSLVRAEKQVLTELTKSLVCAKIREQNKGCSRRGRVHIYLCVLSFPPHISNWMSNLGFPEFYNVASLSGCRRGWWWLRRTISWMVSNLSLTNCKILFTTQGPIVNRSSKDIRGPKRGATNNFYNYI